MHIYLITHIFYKVIFNIVASYLTLYKLIIYFWTARLFPLFLYYMDREAWRAAIHGVAESGHDWATELNWNLFVKEDRISFFWIIALE